MLNKPSIYKQKLKIIRGNKITCECYLEYMAERGD